MRYEIESLNRQVNSLNEEKDFLKKKFETKLNELKIGNQNGKLKKKKIFLKILIY
jgi:hypothetical protein